MKTASGEFTRKQYEFMARAIYLARKGKTTTSPNPCVGAVIVKNDEIIGEGWHQRCGDNHAEVNAIQDVLKNNSHDEILKGASCYVTLEPCCIQGKTPPCTSALINAGIQEVFVAMEDPNPAVSGKGLKILQQAGLEVSLGLMNEDAKTLNPGFCIRMLENRPRVTLKMALSLDGRTALVNGKSQWISSQQSRQDVHKLRAQSCAILTGSGTVMADDPRLTVRLKEQNTDGNFRNPIRVVIDGQEQLNPDYQVFNASAPAIIVLPEQAHKHNPFLNNTENQNISVMQVPLKDGKHIDLKRVLENLARDYQINELLVEAGAGLSGALLRQNLVDELIVYMAPKLMGNGARACFNFEDILEMEEVPEFSLDAVKKIGQDLKISYRPLTKN